MRARGLCAVCFWFFWLLLVEEVPTCCEAQQPAAAAVVLATSELTLRTTASVDIQVCAGGVLSDQRDAVQAAVLAEVQFLLGRTTAVYPIRQYTTGLGTVCYLLLYQAPSPEAASLAETLVAQRSGPGVLSVDYAGQQLDCTTAVVPWQGEDPPLPLWQVSAGDLILWGGAAGACAAFCLVAVCCFVALAHGEDARRAQRLLRRDHRVLRRLFARRRHHRLSSTNAADSGEDDEGGSAARSGEDAAS